MRVYRLSPGDREQVLVRLRPGQAFNTVPPFKHPAHSVNHATIEPLTSVTLYVITCEDFHRLVVESPEVTLTLLRDFAGPLDHPDQPGGVHLAAHGAGSSGSFPAGTRRGGHDHPALDAGGDRRPPGHGAGHAGPHAACLCRRRAGADGSPAYRVTRPGRIGARGPAFKWSDGGQPKPCREQMPSPLPSKY